MRIQEILRLLTLEFIHGICVSLHVALLDPWHVVLMRFSSIKIWIIPFFCISINQFGTSQMQMDQVTIYLNTQIVSLFYYYCYYYSVCVCLHKLKDLFMVWSLPLTWSSFIRCSLKQGVYATVISISGHGRLLCVVSKQCLLSKTHARSDTGNAQTQCTQADVFHCKHGHLKCEAHSFSQKLHPTYLTPLLEWWIISTKMRC